MNESDSARQDFLALRDNASSAQLATVAKDTTPEASYAPCILFAGDYYLFLSQLANHTANLMRNPELGLMLIEDDFEAASAFARQRISLQGRAEPVERDSDCFNSVISLFHQRFGKVMKIIEPLPDFQLFCVRVTSGRFVRGFGQAYELTGARLDDLCLTDPRR
ncbi:MAG: pyridoxamine 5'-phosphate oxidase family protein [Gammaproteobacteria bacterium]|nr:pyridoxamine 5'-phosphate oxidase family protein [Gammaproteobacteria bacterium]